VCLLDEV